MLDPISFIGSVVDGTPILRSVVRRLVDRPPEVVVTQHEGFDAAANDWLNIHHHHHPQGEVPFVIPFVLTVRNHNREHPERIVSVGIRVKRRSTLTWETVATAQVVNIERQPIGDLWIEPLKDHQETCFAQGYITASILYNMIKGQPVVIDLVLHRVGGLIRTCYCKVPWDWAFMPTLSSGARP